jgi:hypothetical protein
VFDFPYWPNCPICKYFGYTCDLFCFLKITKREKTNIRTNKKYEKLSVVRVPGRVHDPRPCPDPMKKTRLGQKLISGPKPETRTRTRKKKPDPVKNSFQDTDPKLELETRTRNSNLKPGPMNPGKTSTRSRTYFRTRTRDPTPHPKKKTRPDHEVISGPDPKPEPGHEKTT